MYVGLGLCEMYMCTVIELVLRVGIDRYDFTKTLL